MAGYTPTVTVELGFGSGPFTASPTWTDVTSYVRGIPRLATGRNYELSQVDTGTLTVILDNTDQRFDPLDTGGPYYGDLLPMVPIRVYATHLTVDYPLWRGVVSSWELSYPETGKDAVVVVEAVDLFGPLSQLAWDTPLHADMLADGPSGMWPIGDASPRVVDASLNGNDGQLYGDVDTEDVVSLPGVDTGAIQLTAAHIDLGTGPQITGTGAYTIEAWIRGAQGVVYAQKDFGATTEFVVEVDTNATLRGSDGTIILTTTLDTLTQPDVWHHVAFVRNSSGHGYLYLDGVEVDNDTAPGSTDNYAGARCTIGGLPSTTAPNYSNRWTGGAIGFVGVYDGTALSAATISDRYDVGLAGWEKETTGTRIGRVLDAAGVPSGLQDLDTGQTIVGAVSGPVDALQHVRAMASSELGVVWVGKDGKVVFHDRDRRRNQTRSTTSQATFSSANIPIGGLRPALDDRLVYNEVVVESPYVGSVGLAGDPTSRATYGPRRLSKTVETATQGDVDSQALWLQELYDVPEVRLPAVTVQPERDSSNWATVFGVTMSDRVTVTLTPPGDQQVSFDQWVEGWSMRIGVSDWDISYDTSPFRSDDLFTLGTSSLGGTDILGY